MWSIGEQPEIGTWVSRDLHRGLDGHNELKAAVKIMNEDVFNYIVRTAETEWKPLVEGGVNTSGIS